MGDCRKIIKTLTMRIEDQTTIKPIGRESIDSFSGDLGADMMIGLGREAGLLWTSVEITCNIFFDSCLEEEGSLFEFEVVIREI